MTGAPAQALIPSRVRQQPDTAARLSGQVADMTDTAVQVAEGLISQPIAVADLAVTASYAGRSDLGLTGASAAPEHPVHTISDIGSLAGVVFAGADAMLSAYALKSALEAKTRASQERDAYRAGAQNFESDLGTRNALAKDIVRIRTELAQDADVHDSSRKRIQTQIRSQTQAWQQQIYELKSLRNIVAEAPSHPSGAAHRARLMLAAQGGRDAVTRAIVDLEGKLTDPEASFLADRRQALAGHPQAAELTHELDIYENRQALTVQLDQLERAQRDLTDRLRGLAPAATRHAIAQGLHSEAIRTTAEAAAHTARSTTGLARAGLDGTQAAMSLAGHSASGGLVAASHIAGAVAGGLSIIAGGATIGIAAYRLNKASQSREAIQAALQPAAAQTNSEIIARAGDHALHRRATQIRTSKWNIVKGSLGVIGGTLGVAAIMATGVGAVALGVAALGVGLVAAGTSIASFCYARRRARADAALRDEVASTQKRTEVLARHQASLVTAMTERNEAVPPGPELEKRAKAEFALQNPHYAVFVFAECLTASDDHPDRTAALAFLERSGLSDTGMEQIRQLGQPAATEDTRQLLRQALESHLFG